MWCWSFPAWWRSWRGFPPFLALAWWGWSAESAPGDCGPQSAKTGSASCRRKWTPQSDGLRCKPEINEKETSKCKCIFMTGSDLGRQTNISSLKFEYIYNLILELSPTIDMQAMVKEGRIDFICDLLQIPWKKINPIYIEEFPSIFTPLPFHLHFIFIFFLPFFFTFVNIGFPCNVTTVHWSQSIVILVLWKDSLGCLSS